MQTRQNPKRTNLLQFLYVSPPFRILLGVLWHFFAAYQSQGSTNSRFHILKSILITTRRCLIICTWPTLTPQAQITAGTDKVNPRHTKSRTSACQTASCWLCFVRQFRDHSPEERQRHWMCLSNSCKTKNEVDLPNKTVIINRTHLAQSMWLFHKNTMALLKWATQCHWVQKAYEGWLHRHKHPRLPHSA